MKKIITFFLIGILVISGLGAATFVVNVENNYNTIIAKFNFCKPVINKAIDNFIDIELSNNETYSIISGKPIVPKETKVFEIPFGAGDLNVDILKGNIKDYIIQSEVRPGPHYKPLDNLFSNNEYALKDESIYSSENLYPDNWFSYRVGCGLNSNNELVTFVSVNLYPIRYQPVSKKLYYLDDAEIVIIAYGLPVRVSYRAIEIARKEGIKVGAFRLITVWPFPDEKVKEVVKNAKAVIVPELNYTGIIAEQVERVTPLGTPIIKVPQVAVFHHPDDILKAIREVAQ